MDWVQQTFLQEKQNRLKLPLDSIEFSKSSLWEIVIFICVCMYKAVLYRCRSKTLHVHIPELLLNYWTCQLCTLQSYFTFLKLYRPCGNDAKLYTCPRQNNVVVLFCNLIMLWFRFIFRYNKTNTFSIDVFSYKNKYM